MEPTRPTVRLIMSPRRGSFGTFRTTSGGTELRPEPKQFVIRQVGSLPETANGNRYLQCDTDLGQVALWGSAENSRNIERVQALALPTRVRAGAISSKWSQHALWVPESADLVLLPPSKTEEGRQRDGDSIGHKRSRQVGRPWIPTRCWGSNEARRRTRFERVLRLHQAVSSRPSGPPWSRTSSVGQREEPANQPGISGVDGAQPIGGLARCTRRPRDSRSAAAGERGRSQRAPVSAANEAGVANVDDPCVEDRCC